MNEKQPSAAIMRFLLYLFGFLLLWEWLRPVGQLTDTDGISVFAVFLVLSLGMHFFQTSWLLRLVIMAGYIIISLQYIYSQIPLFDSEWIGELASDLWHNASNIAGGDWTDLTNRFRTFLFFVLIWLITYLVHYWITVKKNIFLFFVLTVLFLSVLDTFTAYESKMPVIRTVLAGFAFLGLLGLLRICEKEGFRMSSAALRKWAMPLALLLSLSVLLGFAAPKFAPQWADPVPFITNAYSGKGGIGKGSINKMGYDEDDSRLGGSIAGDDTVVLYHDSDYNPYWKIENRDIYTGKGWKSSSIGAVFEFGSGEPLDPDLMNEGEMNETVKLAEYTANVTVMEMHPHVPFPAAGYVREIDAERGDGMVFAFNRDEGRINTFEPGGFNELKLKTFRVDYAVPSYDIQALKNATLEDFHLDHYQGSIQLPDIPDRVRELALEITADKTNLYDKVKAIEDYFDRPEFVYDKLDIPYPAEGQDYVDQFLFETMRGYCDNYSTAMVVLLRANGIPARWVKGYSPGEKSIYKGEPVYSVSNNNAHSWAEVYFPGTGWVPFEPTKSFTNANRFYDSSVDEAAGSIGEDTPLKPEEKEPEVKEAASMQKNLEEPDAAGIAAEKDTPWQLYAAGAAVLLLLTFYAYRKRRRWMPYLMLLRYRLKGRESSFARAYLSLLKQLERAGARRPEGQTLREYAVYIDSIYYSSENSMQQLTAEYERILYRGDSDQQDWTDYYELWEDLIKETAS